MKRSLITVWIVLILLSTLTGCGSGQTSQTSSASAGTASPESTAVTPESAASAPTPTPEVWRAAYIAADGARMRTLPATDADIVMSFACGIEVERLSDEGGWSKVRYETFSGYVSSDLLSDTKPEASSAAPDALGSPKIIIRKAERILELWDGNLLFGRYPVGLGWEPVGAKQVQGDGRTPEGAYYVCVRNDHSKYYLSLGISYPNKQDAQAALDAGVISQSVYDQIADAIDSGSRPPWDTALGGEIMIHGGGATDWTAGCVAVENGIMDILWKYCPVGTPVVIEL